MDRFYEKIILHCGIHKTGSSYLQSLLSVNSSVIGNAGVEYPAFKNPNSPHSGNHSIIAVNYRGEDDVFAYLNKFVHIKFSHPTLLISGEEFSRPHILKPFLTKLIAQNPKTKIEVVYYLRRFDHLLESVYSESVKRTLVGGVEKAAYELDFANLVQPAIDRVGASQVIIRPYNKKLWEKSVLGADFLKAIGIGAAFDEITEGANEELNASFSRIHTFILSCLTKKEDKKNMGAFFFKKPLSAPDTSRYFMTPERRNILNKSHLVKSQQYFATLGIDDFAGFLGIEDKIEEPGWTPFVPDKAIVGDYLRAFVDDGHDLDIEAFMSEIDKRA